MKQILSFSFILLCSFLILACEEEIKTTENENTTEEESSSKEPEVANVTTNENWANFLWRENIYDEELQSEVSSIVLDQDLLEELTAGEKAAIAYIATYIGNECQYKNNDQEGLDCKLITALGLGYQCSEKHLSFLRNAFQGEEEVLKKLENCPEIPFTASSQSTFDELKIKRGNDQLIVFVKAGHVNMRLQSSTEWEETYTFGVAGAKVTVEDYQKSNIKEENF